MCESCLDSHTSDELSRDLPEVQIVDHFLLYEVSRDEVEGLRELATGLTKRNAELYAEIASLRALIIEAAAAFIPEGVTEDFEAAALGLVRMCYIGKGAINMEAELCAKITSLSDQVRVLEGLRSLIAEVVAWEPGHPVYSDARYTEPDDSYYRVRSDMFERLLEASDE